MIPKELQERKQWICWKYENRPGRAKPTKIPYNPLTGFKASTMDASTWTDYETAKARMGQYSGIGFVFTKDDPYIGIDLDHVLDNQGNFIQQDAREIFEKCSSYTEISPSGTGIHILGKAKLHDVAHKVEGNAEKGTCEKELYESGRYFTVTGNQLGNTSDIKNLQNITDELEQVIANEQKSKKKAPARLMSQEPDKVNDLAETQEDAVVTYARSVFPEINTSTDKEKQLLHDKAVHISQFLEDGQITNAKLCKDLFLTYTQQGQTRTVVIPNEGIPFKIPKEPASKKEYFYTKLFRHLDKTRTWNINKQPRLDSLHQVTRMFVAEMAGFSGGCGARKLFDLNEMGKALNQSKEELQNDILSDIGRFPQLGKTIVNWQSGERKGLLVSKEIACMFVQGRTRELQKSTEKSVKELKPTLADAYISMKSLPEFAWFGKRGISCIQISPQQLGEKNYINCAFKNIEITCPLEQISLKSCQFNEVSANGNGTLKNVVLDSCLFDNEKDAKLMQQLGAEMKNCMIYQMDTDLRKGVWKSYIPLKKGNDISSVKATSPQNHVERMER